METQNFLDNLRRGRPTEGVSFGCIPNVIINRCLMDAKANRAIVADGTVQLLRHLETQDCNLMVPHIGAFVKFLKGTD